MQKFISNLKLLYSLSLIELKISSQYKMGRLMAGLAIFCREMISVVVMYLLLVRFIEIKGWNLNELFFLYSFLFLSYALFVFFFTGIRDFEMLIHSGEFDRYLTRPRGLLFQIIVSRIDSIAIVGHGAVGILLFLKTVGSVGIIWNFQNILYYILVVIGGAIIQASIFMLTACFSFWTIRVSNLRNLLFFSSRRFAGYPLSFYPGIIRNLLIFVIPFAFVNYFPSLFFLRKPELAQFWNGFLYLTPVVGAILFILVYLFWRIGVKHYASTGTSMQQ